MTERGRPALSMRRIRTALRNITIAGTVVMVMLSALRFFSVEQSLLFGIVPLAPAAVLVGLVCSAALTNIRAFAAAVVLAIVAVLLTLPGTLIPRTGCDVSTGSDASLVVLSHNVLINNTNVEAVTAQILTIDPDVVVLQEAGERFRRALLDDLAAEYPNALWDRNQVLLSRWPLADEQIVTLVDDTKPLIAATVESPAGDIRVANFHSDPPFRPALRADQRRQFEVLTNDRSFDNIDLLIGDFNAPSSDKRYRTLRSSRFVDGHRKAGCGFGVTWSPRAGSGPPLLAIDHALLANNLVAESFEILDFAGSDHKAIAVRVAVQP